MKIQLYKVKIDSHRKIKVAKKFLWFYIQVNVPEVYEYWIEFRVDEKRFWYGERKPVWDSELDCNVIKTNYVMTKNGCERSLSIIDGIITRTKDLLPNFEIHETLVADCEKYKMYDNVKPIGMKGMFLSDC